MTDKPTALDLPMVNPLPASTQKYFDACKEKLGIIPNVLHAYAFDIDKLKKNINVICLIKRHYQCFKKLSA